MVVFFCFFISIYHILWHIFFPKTVLQNDCLLFTLSQQ